MRMILVLAIVACAAGASSCGSGAQNPQIARNETVLLVPDQNAGSVGWCMIAVSATKVGGCPVVRSRPPVVGETWNSHGVDTAGPVTRGFALTTSQVAAVAIAGGAPLATHSESALPDGFRAVVVEIRGKSLKTVDHGRLPRFMPLNGRQEPILQAREPSWQPTDLQLTLPTRSLRNAARPAAGVCAGPAECSQRSRTTSGAAHPLWAFVRSMRGVYPGLRRRVEAQ
jgi:hypothetical protein